MVVLYITSPFWGADACSIMCANRLRIESLFTKHSLWKSADLFQHMVQFLCPGDWTSFRTCCTDINSKFKALPRPLSSLYLCRRHRWMWHTKEFARGLEPFVASIRHLELHHVDAPSTNSDYYLTLWNRMPNLVSFRLRVLRSDMCGNLRLDKDHIVPMKHLQLLHLEGVLGFLRCDGIDDLFPSLLHLIVPQIGEFDQQYELRKLCHSQVGRQLLSLSMETQLYDSNNGPMSDEFWQTFLNGCASLTSLELRNATNLVAAVRHLASQGDKWQVLWFPVTLWADVAPTSLTASELLPLSRCTNLRRLCLPIADMANLPLHAWSCLEELVSTAQPHDSFRLASPLPPTMRMLGGVVLDAHSIGILAEAKNLTSIEHDSCSLKDACRALSACSQLSSLDLDDDDVDKHRFQFP
jgi:hypothetical protein